MGTPADQSSTDFENEVRRIARSLWPDAEYSGARLIGGQERDGYFEADGAIHLVEATMLRTKAKALHDGQKLVKLARDLAQRRRDLTVACWFVTKHEPTADQRSALGALNYPINALSFAQFQAKLVDVRQYLVARDEYAFGSVRDPANNDRREPMVKYIPLDILQANQATRTWTVDDMAQALMAGQRFVLLGDYGAGKSMTLKEIYRVLKTAYIRADTPRFPIYLNLRDHSGQHDAAEVIERHARNLGFAHPAQIVRAWRAGYAILLLDGFDELTSLGVQVLAKGLQRVRNASMEAVRALVEQQGPDGGVLIAGRTHFFDTDKERHEALSVSDQYVELTLNDFTDEQLTRYLTACGLAGRMPEWMPPRPLLVAYLAASGLLKEVFLAPGGADPVRDPASGWDYLLDLVCKREAAMASRSGLDGATVRKILQRLATIARRTPDGLGPLDWVTMADTFRSLCGYPPDDEGSLLLGRLPGLGVHRAEEGSRAFVDTDFADACAAGDVVAYFGNPYDLPADLFSQVDTCLGDIGLSIVVNAVRDMGDDAASRGLLGAVYDHRMDSPDLWSVRVDLVRAAMELGLSFSRELVLPTRASDDVGIVIPRLELNATNGDLCKVTFRNCYFRAIDIDTDVLGNRLPHFEHSYFAEVDGRRNIEDLPLDVFADSCQFDHFLDLGNTVNVLAGLDLPLPERVLLTILKKIYLQGGHGRKENGLYRGLDHNARRLVPELLRLLQQEGVIVPYRRSGLDMPIWMPERTQRGRVLSMIAAPTTCGDDLLEKANEAV